jgi:hypothetical protein
MLIIFIFIIKMIIRLLFIMFVLVSGQVNVFHSSCCIILEIEEGIKAGK